MRLDCTLNHLPRVANQRARCALHRWVGIETQSQVSYCASCAVHLCIHCYRMFHEVRDLVAMKGNIEKRYKAKKPKTSKKKPKKGGRKRKK